MKQRSSRLLPPLLALCLALALFTGTSRAAADSTIEDDVTPSNNEFDPQTEPYPFSDGAETRYRDAVRALADSGIVNGFEDGTFRPRSGLTRAQACAILARAAGNGNANGTASFSDTSGHWAEGAIAWCALNDIVSGYGDGAFGPDDPLTGYAWSKMLFCALGFDADTYGMNDPDWEDGVTDLLRAYGLSRGMDDFYPDQPILREEVCQLVYNAFSQEPTFPANVSYAADTDGSGVYMIGDSITYLSQDIIKEVLPNITINARSGIWFSRHNSQFGASGTERIAAMGNQSILVFALGSNGGVSGDDIDALFAALEGRDVKIILMTIYYSAGWASTQMDHSNAAVKAAAEHYDNVTCLDWYAAAAAHPEYVYNTSSDHVHLTNPDGMRAFAEVVKEAINEAA